MENDIGAFLYWIQCQFEIEVFGGKWKEALRKREAWEHTTEIGGRHKEKN